MLRLGEPFMKYLKFKEKIGKKAEVIDIIKKSSLVNEIKERLIYELRNCGETIYIQQCKRCNTKYFAGYFACQWRFCPVCSYKLHLNRFARILSVLDSLDVYFLTHAVFTLRSYESLKHMIKDVKKFLRAFRKDKKICDFFKRFVMGYYYNIEVKKGNVGWHVHVHYMVVTNEKKDFFDLFKEVWKRITKGEGSVYVRHVKNTVESVLETTKYSVKISYDIFSESEHIVIDDEAMTIEVSLNDFAEFFWATYKEKLFNVGGCFIGVDFESDLNYIKECKVCGSNEFDLIIARFGEYLDFEVYDVA